MSEKANGRVALITGGSRGIGRSIVLQLARDGFDTAFCFKSASDKAAEVQGEVEAMGRRAYAAPCDVAAMESVVEFVKAAESELGGIEVLVNNAGIVRDRALVMMTEQEWNEVVATNLAGVFNFCKVVIFSFMKRKSGKIVNVSSISGVYGNVAQVNYSASKAGIVGLSKALAKEAGPYNVCVNVVAPGFIATDMTAGLKEKQVDDILQRCPLRRLGEAEEVAHLVSFLVSDRAGYITGQVIQVDGGLVL